MWYSTSFDYHYSNTDPFITPIFTVLCFQRESRAIGVVQPFLMLQVSQESFRCKSVYQKFSVVYTYERAVGAG